MKSIQFDSFVISVDERICKIIGISDTGGRKMSFSALSWSVELSSGKTLTPSSADYFNVETADGKARLVWRGEAEIGLTLTVFGDSLKTKLDVKSDTGAIKRVIYPIYEGIVPLRDDRFLLPWQNGIEIKDVLHTLLGDETGIRFWMGRGGKGYYENEYPTQYSYQLFAYYSEKGSGYTVTSDDGEAYIKTVGLYKSEDGERFDLRFINYPEGMNKVRTYEMPYLYSFAFIDGGWREAAMRYREWAKGQRWYAPLSERPNTDVLDTIDFCRINHEHYRLGTDDAEFLETARLIKERLDARPLMHWYGWNKAPRHGDWYPEMADWSDSEWLEGLHRRNAELDAAGVKKIPYVNVHLWDRKLKSFAEESAPDSVIMPESLEITDEPWLSDRNLFAVCHATEKIKKKANALFSRLVTEDGFDGIYIDQVASFNATLCFSESHGHPVGGGKWWAEEYHKMIAPFREEMCKGKILTTESCAECYHDLFDLFLILDTSGQSSGFFRALGADNVESLPLFKMIYGDSAVAYGSGCKLEGGDGEFEFNYIRNILFGMIPTAEGVELAYKDEEYKWSVLRLGVDFFKANRDVLLYGALLDYKTIGDGRKVTFGKLEKQVPDVICALYDYGGRKYTFGYNFTDIEITVTVNGASLAIPPHTFVTG